jgi:hypothetical protein
MDRGALMKNKSIFLATIVIWMMASMPLWALERGDAAHTGLVNWVFPIMAIVLGDTMHYTPGYGPGTHVYWGYDGLPTHYILGDHEAFHIPQERKWGPAFIPAYLISELFPGVNPFEAAADTAAKNAYQETYRK